MTKKQLRELKRYLNQVLISCDGTHKYTRLWLAEQGLDVEKEIEQLERHAGHCDCEVYFNA